MERRAEIVGVAGMEARCARGSRLLKIHDECGADVPLGAQPRSGAEGVWRADPEKSQVLERKALEVEAAISSLLGTRPTSYGYWRIHTLLQRSPVWSAIRPSRSTAFYPGQGYPAHLRRIRFKDETGKRLVFLTNTSACRR